MTKRNFIITGILLFLFLAAGLLTAVSVWKKSEPVSFASGGGVSEQDIANADLPKLGTKALREKGIETKCAILRLKDTLPDGSRKVVLVLANGREMKGRLYKENQRLKVAADVWSTFE